MNTIGSKLCSGALLGVLKTWTDTAQSDAGNTQRMPVKADQRVMVTQNLSLDRGLVNGAEGKVVGVRRAGVALELACGRVEVLHQVSRWVEHEGRSRCVSGYPLVGGYATTVHKAEGRTLDSAGIVFERFAPPGWAYTAVTRVRRLADLRFFGRPLETHFVPRC